MAADIAISILPPFVTGNPFRSSAIAVVAIPLPPSHSHTLLTEVLQGDLVEYCIGKQIEDALGWPIEGALGCPTE